MTVWGGLTNSYEKKRSKRKGDKEWYTHLKAGFQRIAMRELWCWRRLLRVPLTERRSNQAILKEISPEYSLEGLMKLKFQYFSHLMWRADSLEKTLMLGKIESVGFLTRYDGELRETLVWCQGSQGFMSVAEGVRHCPRVMVEVLIQPSHHAVGGGAKTQTHLHLPSEHFLKR